MTVDHRGTELDDQSMTILELIADRSADAEQNGAEQPTDAEQNDTDQSDEVDQPLGGATRREMEERTGLASGSVHHRLRHKLEPENLIEIDDTESQDGAANDRQIWILTDHGENWLESLDATDYSPAAASDKAVEISQEARRHARKARNNTADSLDRVEEIDDKLKKTATDHKNRLDNSAAKIEQNEKSIGAVERRVNNAATEDSLTELGSTLREVKEVAREPDDELVSDVDSLKKQVTNVDRMRAENNALIVGWDSDPDDEGLEGEIEAARNNIYELEKGVKSLVFLTVAAGCLSLVALIVSLSALLLAIGVW